MNLKRTFAVSISTLVAGAGILLAPSQLGGSASYAVVDGTSMNPMLHRGDLVVARVSPTYKVGEIVLYKNTFIKRQVMHRIFKIQHGRYYFKGDNNTFIDPGYATRSQLLGKLWFYVPHAGTVVTWIGRPTHAALVAAILAVLLVLGGSGTQRVRRRIVPAPAGSASTGGMRKHLHRPRKIAENIVFAIAAALAAITAAVAFTTPTKQVVPVSGAYRETGTFSYTGQAKRSAVYPTGTVRTGQPIFLADVQSITATFSYRFQSKLPHGVRGTASLRALVSSDAISWHDLLVAPHTTSFNGDRVTVRETLNLKSLAALATRLTAASGAVGSDYQLILEPTITVRGIVGHTHITDTFKPTLPFTLSQAMLKVNAPAPTTLPGATYETPSAAALLATALHPEKAGSAPAPVPNHVTLLRYQIAVSVLRGLAVGFAGIALAALLLKLLRPKRVIWSAERRIATRRGCIILDVHALARASGTTDIEIPNFDQLAALAQQQNQPILHELADGGTTYAVEHGHHTYTYTTPATAAQVANRPAASPPVRTAAPAMPRRRRRRLVPTALLALGLLVVGGTVLSAFTAASSVPPSYAGSSDQPLVTDTLAPAACSSLGITTLVTGSRSFSNAKSHALILGSAGNDTISDSGNYNCIVAGGGTDNVSARSTSTCIIGTGAKSKYNGCVKQT